jgi:hypothetical protein
MGRKSKASWSGDIKAVLVLDVASGKDTGKKALRLFGERVSTTCTVFMF